MKTFFRDFPLIDYNSKEVVNISAAFFLRRVSIDKSLCFQKLSVPDTEIPESLANDLYRSPRHYWALLLVNDCINPYTDWVMTSDSLEEYTRMKYKDGIFSMKKDGTKKVLKGSVGIGGVHHFENINTERHCDDVEDEYYRDLWTVDPTSIGSLIIPVTNLSYEKGENEKRRQILIINPRAMIKFEDDFQRVMKK